MHVADRRSLTFAVSVRKKMESIFLGRLVHRFWVIIHVCMAAIDSCWWLFGWLVGRAIPIFIPNDGAICRYTWVKWTLRNCDLHYLGWVFLASSKLSLFKLICDVAKEATVAEINAPPRPSPSPWAAPLWQPSRRSLLFHQGHL